MTPQPSRWAERGRCRPIALRSRHRLAEHRQDVFHGSDLLLHSFITHSSIRNQLSGRKRSPGHELLEPPQPPPPSPSQLDHLQRTCHSVRARLRRGTLPVTGRESSRACYHDGSRGSAWMPTRPPSVSHRLRAPASLVASCLPLHTQTGHE